MIASARSGVRLWNAITGEEEWPLRGGNWVALSPDGKWLVTSGAADGQDMVIWNVPKRREVRTFTGWWGKACFSPDGTKLACWQGGTNTITVLDTNKWEKIVSVDGWLLSFGNQGRELFVRQGGRDKPEVLFLDARTGARGQRMNLEGASANADTLFFTPTTLIIGGSDHKVRWLDRSSGIETGCVPGRLLALAPSSQELVLESAGKVRIVGLDDWKEHRAFSVSMFTGARAVVSADGKTLAFDHGNQIRVWDSVAGKTLHPPRGHADYIRFLGFSRDGKQLVSAADSTLRRWDPVTGKELSRPIQLSSGIVAVGGTADGNKVVTMCGDKVSVWDAPDMVESVTFQVPSSRQDVFGVSSDGKVLAMEDGGASRQFVAFHDLASGKEVSRFSAPLSSDPDGPQTHVFSLSPDGKTLARVTNVISLWDTGTRRRYATIRPPRKSGPVISQRSSFSWSPNGKVSALGYDEEFVGLWEVESGGEICRIRVAGANQVTPVVRFSPDGRLLAIGGADGTTHLWDLIAGRMVAHFPGHRGEVTAVAFSSGRQLLAAGGADGTVLTWDISQLKRPPDLSDEFFALARLHSAWADLGSRDVGAAYRALGLLALSTKSVPFLKSRVEALVAADRRVVLLVSALDDEAFETRENAMRDLENLGWDAEWKLREVSGQMVSAEVYMRVTQLLTSLPTDSGRPTQQECFRVRAVQVLETLATSDAREVLHKLAKGEPRARLTQEAKAALSRLGESPK